MKQKVQWSSWTTSVFFITIMGAQTRCFSSILVGTTSLIKRNTTALSREANRATRRVPKKNREKQVEKTPMVPRSRTRELISVIMAKLILFYNIHFQTTIYKRSNTSMTRYILVKTDQISNQFISNEHQCHVI